jgi:hypothetical protein
LFLADREVFYLFVNRSQINGRAHHSRLASFLGDACHLLSFSLLSLFSGSSAAVPLSYALVQDSFQLLSEIRRWGFFLNKNPRPNLRGDKGRL